MGLDNASHLPCVYVHNHHVQNKVTGLKAYTRRPLQQTLWNPQVHILPDMAKRLHGSGLATGRQAGTKEIKVLPKVGHP